MNVYNSAVYNTTTCIFKNFNKHFHTFYFCSTNNYLTNYVVQAEAIINLYESDNSSLNATIFTQVINQGFNLLKLINETKLTIIESFRKFMFFT